MPLKEVIGFYRGTVDEDAVLAASDAGPEAVRRNQRCYAHLYLGLFYEATGSLEKAQEQMVLSAVNYSMDHYMGKVAQMHVQLRGWDASQAQEKAE